MGFVTCAFNTPINRYKFLVSLLTIFIGAVIAYSIPTNWTALNLSEYKPLSKILQIPDNKIVREVSSPRGLITVVKTGINPLRYAPGLSLKNPYITCLSNWLFSQMETPYHQLINLIMTLVKLVTCKLYSRAL